MSAGLLKILPTKKNAGIVVSATDNSFGKGAFEGSASVYYSSFLQPLVSLCLHTILNYMGSTGKLHLRVKTVHREGAKPR